MDREELLKLEHATLLEEFKTARENMLFDLGLARQIVNLTLAAAGILVAGTPYIVQSNLPTLFLIAPFVFYPLAWSQVRYLHGTKILGKYQLTVLVPRIRKVLKELSPDESREFDSIMSWEAYVGTAYNRPGLIFLPVAAGNYGINLLATLFSVCAYFVFVYQKLQIITTLDWILIVANILLFSYSVFLGFWSWFSSDISKSSDSIRAHRSRRSK